MIEFSGTPGPWEPVADFEANGIVHTAVVNEQVKRMICSISPMADVDAANLSNAWLIAAAPDLLAACQRLVRLISRVSYIDDDRVLPAAQAAIAKALGEPCSVNGSV